MEHGYVHMTSNSTGYQADDEILQIPIHKAVLRSGYKVNRNLWSVKRLMAQIP